MDIERGILSLGLNKNFKFQASKSLEKIDQAKPSSSQAYLDSLYPKWATDDRPTKFMMIDGTSRATSRKHSFSLSPIRIELQLGTIEVNIYSI